MVKTRSLYLISKQYWVVTDRRTDKQNYVPITWYS